MVLEGLRKGVQRGCFWRRRQCFWVVEGLPLQAEVPGLVEGILNSSRNVLRFRGFKECSRGSKVQAFRGVKKMGYFFVPFLLP